jgi:hypothetical protein
MLGITTLMFAMGIAALVLVTLAELQTMRLYLSPNELSILLSTRYYAWAGGIACLMVCLHNPLSSV